MVKKTKVDEASKQLQKKNGYLLIMIIILFVFALSQATCLLALSLSVEKDVVSYSESGNVDYKVHLVPNDFYESEYLDRDMVYVSSLIDYIDPTFSYNFDVSKKNNIDYSYEVIGEIVIYDNAKEKVFFKKDYNLVEETKESIKNTDNFKISKNVKIDYKHYNSLANDFKRSYGISSKSDFIVKFKLHYKNNDDNLKLVKDKEMTLTVPLTENEVNIFTSDSISSKYNQVFGSKHIVIDNLRKLIAAILMAIIAIILLGAIIMNLFEINLKRNKYDIFIKRILREYDRLIVNTKTAPSTTKKEVVTVSSFPELLDVHDNLNVPIMYYIEKEHQRCVFYINHAKQIYILRIDKNDKFPSN